ncbi:MAG TPA: hypothetical protein VIX81_01620 [Gammaproteobacteria bacterium]
MGKESDRIPHDIGCLATHRLPATLMSTAGYHCDVWQSNGSVIRAGKRRALNLIIKRCKDPLPFVEVQLLQRDYRELKERLGAIVPDAAFVATCIDGHASVIVLAEVVQPWFNIANPGNEEEAVPLLRKLRAARAQLRTFVAAAREWHAEPEERVIDLWGLDNLVLDRDRRVRYIDSFRVFFYGDMLHTLAHPDYALVERIELSLQRLEYLEYLLRECSSRRVTTAS